MPKKSQKSKSKRMTLKQKYKIKKKVKEHVRKKKKQEKKLGIKPKGPKDPGLPSQWPFKEELIKEFAFKRAQILADEKQKKEERKARQRAAANGDGDEAMEGGEGEEGEEQALLRLQATVTNKQEDFETRKRARLTADFQSDKDNSKKAFYKEFKKVVELADVVIQVLDARDPLACRCPDVETYIRSTNPNKRIVLLLNKMDLVPREVGEQWLKYFREELPTVAFKCNTQQQADKLGRKKMPKSKRAALEAGAGGLQSSNCLGADTLIQLLKNYCRNTGIKTSITVGVVGLPNVGKSSLINSLKRARVAQVGNTPGVTKSVQEVHLDKNIKLLDSPGIVFAAAEDDSSAVLRNCVKIERLRDPAGPVVEILKRVPPKPLMALYKVGVWETADQFLQQVAQTRGKLRKGGVPDMQATAKVVLQDWYDGRIPYFTRPPSRGNEAFASAEVVASWASEFDAEQVFANEQSAVIAHLPPMDGEDGAEGAAGAGAKGGRQFFQLESMGGAKVDLESMDADDDAEEDGGDMEHDGDQEDEDGSTYGLPAKKARAGAVAPAAILYGEEGQFNPHAARAEKKKAKKGDKEAAVAAAVAAKAAKGPKGAKGKEEDNEDFEFEAEGSEEDDGEGEEGSEDGEGDEEEDDGMESD